MALINTGLKGFARLAKVTNDGTNRPLDVNGMLVTDPLLQHIKLNTAGQPDYIAPIQDLVSCPLPITVVPPPPPPVVTGTRRVIVINSNSQSDINSIIEGVQVNNIEIITPSPSDFPMNGVTQITGIYGQVGDMSNSTIKVNINTVGTHAVRVVIGGTDVRCSTTQGTNTTTFLGVDLSNAQDFTVTLDTNGTTCS